MLANGNAPVRIRNQTHEQTPQWSFRVMRSVAPNQPELETQLTKLVEHTRQFVDFKNIENLGRLGVTLLMLDPVMGKIMGINRHEKIPGDRLQKLEQEVNGSFSQTQHDVYHVPIVDQFAPFGLYGFQKPYLGLYLKPIYKDEQLAQDRELVIKHIIDNYPVKEPEIRRGLLPLKPHITLGTVLWDELETYQQMELKRDPNRFLRAYMRDAVNGRKAEGFEVASLPVFPETICLNGLQAYREQKTTRGRKVA